MNSTSEANVIPIGRMSEAEYDRERAQLRATYGDSGQEAAAKRDQAFAALFVRTGWTQEQLAKKEGRSQFWVSKRLLFGRFIDFISTDINPELPVSKLKERTFREYWDRTDKAEGNERIRFRAVADLMRKELTLRKTRRPKIDNATLRQVADGKWHGAEMIANKLSTDADHVHDLMQRVKDQRANRFKVEKKPVGKSFKYRLFPQDSKLSSAEVAEKLTPIIEELDLHGRRAPGTVSNTAITVLAGRLRNLLKEWRE